MCINDFDTKIAHEKSLDDCYLSFVITELEKKSSSGGKFFGIECDLDKDEDIRKMFDWIKNHPELGQIDVCICNAGIFLINTVE